MQLRPDAKCPMNPNRGNTPWRTDGTLCTGADFSVTVSGHRQAAGNFGLPDRLSHESTWQG